MKLVTALVLLFASIASPAFACNDFQKLFGGCKPAATAPAPLPHLALLPHPGFETVTIYSQYGAKAALNPRYFADGPTASTVATIFGAYGVTLEKPDGVGGPMYATYPDGSPASERFLIFPPGTRLRAADGSYFLSVVPFSENAGFLADIFVRYPEKYADPVFGSAAVKLGWEMLRTDYEAAKAAKAGSLQ